MIHTPIKPKRSTQSKRAQRLTGGTIDAASTCPHSEERNDAMNVMTKIAAQHCQDDGIGERSALRAARQAWDAALEDYTTKRAAAAAEPHRDELSYSYCEAMDRLVMDVPAPDLAALGRKIGFFREIQAAGSSPIIPKIFDALIDDVARLELQQAAKEGARSAYRSL